MYGGGNVNGNGRGQCIDQSERSYARLGGGACSSPSINIHSDTEGVKFGRVGRQGRRQRRNFESTDVGREDLEVDGLVGEVLLVADLEDVNRACHRIAIADQRAIGNTDAKKGTAHDVACS